jgi:RNA polymerase sigma factor (sigma-70 family)
MTARLAAGAASDLQILLRHGQLGAWTDARLLEQFRTGGGPVSEAAITTLIRRHGPMVLRVCRGILADENDAQDAFQATFLVLVREAGAVRNRSSVASWLHGVAYRVASRSKVDVARRRAHERRAASMKREFQHDRAERPFADQAVLNEEIRRLPERYRVAVVLVYLEGLSQEQAAAQLGWPSGTVRGRLSRARDLLRVRLSRRGLTLPAAALTSGLASASAEATTVPAALVDATVRAVRLTAAGKAAAGAVPAAVLALANSTRLASSYYARLKLPVALLGLGLASFSAEWLVVSPGPQQPPARESPPTRDEATPPLSSSVAVRPSRPAWTALEAPRRESAAHAFPLRNIRIDGDLRDWPRDRIRYPIRKVFAVPNSTSKSTGYGALEGADLSSSADLSPEFSVAYDPDENLLYLAVTVRDDELVIGNSSHLDTDAIEVYIDGLYSDRRIADPGVSWYRPGGLSAIPVQQYIAIPGSGRIYGVGGSQYDTNPILLGADLRQTRSSMAFRREGDITTYEWAIEPFDRYPDRPTQLGPGKRIGFDLAVADRDVPLKSPVRDASDDRRVAWAYWGPQWSGLKVLDAGSLGEIILTGTR